MRVADLPGKGKGLVALKPFKADEVLFMEAPLGSLQHASNKPLVRACAWLVGRTLPARHVGPAAAAHR